MRQLKFLLLLLLLSANFGQAAVQRIALSPGTFSIRTGESIFQEGICLNKLRHAPDKGQEIKYLLTSPEDVLVRIQGKGEITLSQAIKQNLVRVEGTGLISLKILNTSSGNIDFVIKNPAVLGAEPESIVDVKHLLKKLAEPNAGDSLDFDLQEIIWKQQLNEAMAGLRDGTLAPDSIIVRDNMGEFVRGEKKDGDYEAVFYNDQTHLLKKVYWGATSDEYSFFRKSDGGLEPRDREATIFLTKKCNAIVAKESSSEISFAHMGFVDAAPHMRTQLQLGSQSVDMDATAFGQFLDGGEPPAELKAALGHLNSGKPIIVWRDDNEIRGHDLYYEALPDSGKKSPRLPGFVNPTELAVRLQNLRADQGPVYLAHDFKLARENLAALPRVQKAADINIYNDVTSLGPANQALLQPITDRLKASGMNVSSDKKVVKAANLVIISGHKDTELQALVTDLAFEGSLKDKLLVMLSCGADGEEEFNTELLSPFLNENAPVGILFYREKINPVTLKDVLLKLTSLVKGNDKLNVDFRMLLKKAVDEVRHETAPTETETLKQLQQIEDAVIQLTLSSQQPKTIA